MKEIIEKLKKTRAEYRKRIIELRLLLVKTRRERESVIKTIKELIREERETIERIKRLKRFEFEIHQKIVIIIKNIHEYELEIKITRKKETDEEILFKRYSFETIKIHNEIDSLVEIIKKHIKLLDEYSVYYHKYLDGPSGALDCNKCFREHKHRLIKK